MTEQEKPDSINTEQRTYIMTEMKSKILAKLTDTIGALPFYRNQEIYDATKALGEPRKVADRVMQEITKVSRGRYSFNSDAQPAPTPALTASFPQKVTQIEKPVRVTALDPVVPANFATTVASSMNDSVFVPAKDPSFVPWGNFSLLKKALQSKSFFPIYISGLSGNGKTMMAEQACAQLNREYVRVQISPETDEDDLIGGFRLVKGETVFQKGPVLKAMEHGAVLLIDELDRGTNKIMCLQGVLEGKPILIKKTGEIMTPAPGFTVVATANTKGRGSDDGRYTGANIIDDAFIERFVVTLEQPYATPTIEEKILKKHMHKFDTECDAFIVKLIAWGTSIRKTYEDGAIGDFVSTRRLCHIINTYSIFGDERSAVELCTNRFDDDLHQTFMDLFDKIGDGTELLKAQLAAEKAETEKPEIA